MICPFELIIDNQEKHPFGFTNIRAGKSHWDAITKALVAREDLKAEDVTYKVETIWDSLGTSHGDYALFGFEGRCHVERKSCDDAIGTLLAWDDREERFERELEWLSALECAAVVVECSYGDSIASIRQYGTKTIEENCRSFSSRARKLQLKYSVGWIWADSRRHAEIETFRIFENFWKHLTKEEKTNV